MHLPKFPLCARPFSRLSSLLGMVVDPGKRIVPTFQSQIKGLAQQLVHSGSSVPDAQIQAQGLIYQSLGAQAQTLAYVDAFMVLTVGAGIMFLFAFIMRKNDPSAGGEVAVG